MLLLKVFLIAIFLGDPWTSFYYEKITETNILKTLVTKNNNIFFKLQFIVILAIF